MRWMIWPRQYGKTYTVQQWWLEDPGNRVILTENEELARLRRRDLADKLKSAYPGLFDTEIERLVKNRVMSYRSWPNLRGTTLFRSQVAVDGAENILRSLLGGVCDVQVITGAGRNEEPDPDQVARVKPFHDRARAMGIDPET